MPHGIPMGTQAGALDALDAREPARAFSSSPGDTK